MPADSLSPSDLWQRTVETVKDRVNNLSLWEAMEKAVGISIEQNTFIVGLNARLFNEAGHLNVPQHRNAIEHALKEITGRPLAVRIIEGDTLEDWNYTKTRDDRAAAMRQATYQRKDREEAESQSWDALHEYISRAYSDTPMRQLPQNKARFLAQMLYVIADALEQLYTDPPDEMAERHLARVIDKVATSADVPSTLVALELERLRSWRQQNPSPNS